MKYNMKNIMTTAWNIVREKGMTMKTALKLAWREAKGMTKGYAVRVEDVRPQITSYIMKLVKNIKDIHDEHKLEALKAALLAPIDAKGIAVLDGKTTGLVKYAVKNA